MGDGYVELPYTLPQDSTLFLLFRERTPDIWLAKLDWIAKHGGMALLITHPDYMSFDNHRRDDSSYPATLFEQLLDWVKRRHPGQYWNASPKEVAAYFQQTLAPGKPPVSNGAHKAAARPLPSLTSSNGNGSHAKARAVSGNGRPKPKIWIDLDNTPHVPFFEPIIDELKAHGFPLLLTARDAFQVYDLADKKGMQYIRVGRHHGKHRLIKAAGLMYRSLQMAPIVLREKPLLAVSHGSRAQILLGNCLRIPTLMLEDYEFSTFPPFMRPTFLMAPAVIPDASLPCRDGHILKYPGLKEDVYAWKLHPDWNALKELGLGKSDLVVTVRPPATEAHYHNPESEALFETFMDWACETSGVKVVLLPRNKRQGDLIRHGWPQWFVDGKTVVPAHVLDGMNLIWHSDLVVSGGGTMNREAAALGVPVYSIFRGAIGAVDNDLKARGRLVLVETPEQVRRKIDLRRRPRKAITEVTSTRALQTIVDAIEEIVETRVH